MWVRRGRSVVEAVRGRGPIVVERAARAWTRTWMAESQTHWVRVRVRMKG